MYQRYNGDPFWMVAKFGNCAACHKSIKGKRVFYYPRQRQAFCTDCGSAHVHERDFVSCAQDEFAYNGYR